MAKKKKGPLPSHLLSPDDTVQLIEKLEEFLDQKVLDPITGKMKRLGSYKFGVYAFKDYDGQPIYVGQTAEKLSSRIRRHLTNQRSDAAAMNVLDPFEVHSVEVWPLSQYEGKKTKDPEANAHLNWLEYEIFQQYLAASSTKAILNEKDPAPFPQKGFIAPTSVVGTIVSDKVLELRRHPDTRLARRAETIALLAKVISERKVRIGLRKALLTQAKRIVLLAENRLDQFAGVPDLADADADADEDLA
jgi:hypothetical protein